MKRFLSMLIISAMLLAFVPSFAFASDDTTTTDGTISYILKPSSIRTDAYPNAHHIPMKDGKLYFYKNTAIISKDNTFINVITNLNGNYSTDTSSSSVANGEVQFATYRDSEYHVYVSNSVDSTTTVTPTGGTATTVSNTNYIAVKKPVNKDTTVITSNIREKALLSADGVTATTYTMPASLNSSTAPFEFLGRAAATSHLFMAATGTYGLFKLGTKADPDANIANSAEMSFAVRIKVPEDAASGKYQLKMGNCLADNINDNHYADANGATCDVYFTKIDPEVGFEALYAWNSATYSSYVDNNGKALDSSAYAASANKLTGTYYSQHGKSTTFSDVLTLEAGAEYILYCPLNSASVDVDALNAATATNVYSDGSSYYQNFKLSQIDFIPVEEEEDATATSDVTFAAYSSINGGSVSVSGIDYNGDVDSEARGEEITVTAPEVDGYKFRYWVRGSAETGKWVSSSAKYSFTLMTNTMLTAVYDEVAESDAQMIEFWNQNGAYIGTATVENGAVTAPDASLTGYTFENWYVDSGEIFDVSAVTDAVTRVVARYTANSVSGAVTVDGTAESGVVYNKEITKTADGATCWYRDDVLVAYGSSYTYYVWDATEITSSTEAVTEKAPLVVLEEGNDGAYMIEYDAGDKKIVEAGIVFGDGATIESCSGKATSQKNLSHGQFAAKPESTTSARGYIIYQDGTEYKVKYSD